MECELNFNISPPGDVNVSKLSSIQHVDELCEISILCSVLC